MSSTYNEIKRILFSERELDINKINEYLDIDFKATINIIFDIFYDSILISSLYLIINSTVFKSFSLNIKWLYKL